MSILSYNYKYIYFNSSAFTASELRTTVFLGFSVLPSGLIVFDTFTHWTVFGQIVILIMIQIGGLGLMTIITMISIFLRKKIASVL